MTIRPLVAACVALSMSVATLAPRDVAYAQDATEEEAPSTGLVALTATAMTLTTGLGTWIATMPWGGFWNNRADVWNPFALIAGAVAGLAAGALTIVLARQSETRMGILAISAAGALELELGVGLIGGLYHLFSPPGACEEGCSKLLFGLAPWLGTLVGLTGAVIHLATE